MSQLCGLLSLKLIRLHQQSAHLQVYSGISQAAWSCLCLVSGAWPLCAQLPCRLAGMHAVDFKFNAGNPLEVDAVLVDEASMVDVKMGLALLEALPKGCRLVLVGTSLQTQE